MSFLGDIGSLYMLFLIALLIVGLGMIAKGFIDYLLEKKTNNKVKSKGVEKMQNINWLRLSMFSLIGIIVSLLLLSFLSSSGLPSNDLSANYSTGLSSSLLGTNSSLGLTGTANVSSAGTVSVDNNVLISNYNQLQQQMNQMQTQIYQLQLIIQNMSNIQSSSSGTSNSGSSGSGSSGSMPMM